MEDTQEKMLLRTFIHVIEPKTFFFKTICFSVRFKCSCDYWMASFP